MAAFIKQELAGLLIPVKPNATDVTADDRPFESFCSISDVNADADVCLSV